MHRATKFSVHKAAVDQQQGISQGVKAMWEALCRRHVGLRDLTRDGVHTVDLDEGVTVRWSCSESEGALACEVINLGKCDWWQAFIVPVGNDELLTGWCRRGQAQEAPEPWEEAVVSLEIGDRCTPIRDPEFLSLVAAMCASGNPAVGNHDLEIRLGISAEAKHYEEMAARQAATIRAIRYAVKSRDGDSQSAELKESHEYAYPGTLAELDEWADANADRIVIMPRALAEGRKSLYEDAGLVYAALELLAETYRLVKLGKLDRELLKRRAEDIGVFMGGSIDSGRAGAFGDEYFISYGGRRRFLDQHIGRGGSRDPRFTLRVYYTWCEERKLVVVGWMTTHLTNKLT